MRSSAYWERRARQRMAQYHRSADSTINTVTRAYDKAVADLTVEIEAIYNTFGENGQLTPAEARAALNEVISRGEWQALKGSLNQIKDRDIRKQVLAKLNAPAYRARITRLEALRAQAYVQSKVIADVELAAGKAGYMDVINEAYYRTMFDLQKGLGVGFEFAAIPNRVVKTILKRPWSGRHFSSRIWGNTDYLADKLTEIITAGFMSGAGVASMRRQLQEITGAGKYAAARLIRTETTYMANAAEMESYAEAGIDQYIYVATLDSRTSPICQKLDRKVFPIKDAVPGKNLPPMHPNCRSTTRAYLGADTLKGVERRARDPETGETYLVPGDMDYAEWRKQYVRDAASNASAPGAIANVGNNGYNQDADYVVSARDIYAKWDKTDRKVFADELLKANGLNLQAQIHPLGKPFGQCALNLGDPQMRVLSYELNLDDKRPHRYQVKTAFHELFHAKANGLTHDARILGFGDWGFCDDTFAEVSAHYFAREIGISENITPSYANHLARALPRLKVLPEFANCRSIADFGAVAAKFRFGQTPTAVWSDLHRHIQTDPVNLLKYSRNYVDYIEQNVELLVDQLLENVPMYRSHRSSMIADAHSLLDVIKTGNGQLTSNQGFVLDNVLILAMNHKGVVVP